MPTAPKKAQGGVAQGDSGRAKAGARAEVHAKRGNPLARGATHPPEPAGKRARRDPPEPQRRAVKPKRAAHEAPARKAPSVASPEASPLARSVAGFEEGAGADPAAPSDHDSATYKLMELSWDDEPPAHAPEDDLVSRWVKRGDTLLRHLAEHGAARHEYRADLKEGRFVWIDPDGKVSAEALARVLCSWSPATSAVVMAWADPVVRGAAIGRVDGMASDHDDVDEEGAWRIAMEAAEAARAEYLYRVTTPDAWYFLALFGLSFTPGRASFSPGAPVGLVLRGLDEVRRAVESRAEPTDVVRERLAGLGRALVHEAEYAYRGTDWVSRLTRTGRRLVTLADRLPRATFQSIAAGRLADDWLGRDATIDLAEALTLLEDEWALFA